VVELREGGAVEVEHVLHALQHLVYPVQRLCATPPESKVIGALGS
jgi:hypothetical protein